MKSFFTTKMIKYSLIFSGVLFFWGSYSFAGDPPETLWTKTFGGSNIDYGNSTQQTSDGGYIVTGWTRSFGTMSGRNIWLIKTDSSGNEMWNNAYGGNNDEEGHYVKQTSDGGYIITGWTKSFGAGAQDVFLLKTDSAGNQSWFKTFGGSNDDEGYSVLQTNDGGYVIGGVTSSFAIGGRDVWIIKTDSSGNEIWKKNHGSISSDGAWDIKQTTDGGFILTGWTFQNNVLGNALLFKTDSSGNELWRKSFGGSNVDRGYSAQQTFDGGYILTGYTSSSGAGLDDMLLVKTDSLGEEVWSRTFGGSGRDYGYSVQQTFEGGYIIVGSTLSFGAGNEDLWVVKTNPSGNMEWNKTFGGSSVDVGEEIEKTSDGGFIIVGRTLSYGAGLQDAWLIRLGPYVPVELISFTVNVSGNNTELSWITASETNNRGFEIERKTSGSDWGFISFVEGNGTSIKTNYYSFIDLNLTPGEYYYRLKQIDFSGTFEYSNPVRIEVTASKEFILEQNYPNPFNASTKIRYTIPVTSLVTINLFDILGNEIETLISEVKPEGSHEFNWTSENLTSGIYYYRMQAGDFISTRKIVLLK